MNIFPLFAFSAFLVYLYLGVYAIRLDSRAPLNRIFFALCMSFAVWAFSYIFFYSAPDKESAWFWYKASSIGWCLFPALTLHFFLVLTERQRLITRRSFYPLLYLPSLVFLAKALTSSMLVEDFVRGSFGWYEVAPLGSMWVWAFPLYYLGYVLTGAVLVFQWGYGSTSVRKKRQARVTLFTAVPTLIIATVTDTLLPVLDIGVLPSMAVIIILFWVAGIWYSIVRHKLMVLTPSIAADEIISKMVDMLILVDPEGKITKVNAYAEQLLGYSERELIGRHFISLMLEQEVAQAKCKEIKESMRAAHTYEGTLQSKNGEGIPVSITCASMKDKGGDLIGIVIVGHDMRQMKQLEREVAERKHAEQTLLAAEAKFRNLVEQCLVGIYIVQNERLVYVNPKFAEIFGVACQEDILSKPMTELVFPESRSAVAECLNRCASGMQQSVSYSFRGKRMDNWAIDIEAHGTLTEINGSPAVIGTVLDITERKHMEEKIRYQAYHDPLTGLPNRTLFNDYLSLLLAKAHRDNKLLAVLFLDLDRFKGINDSLGHTVGDKLLKGVADLLKSCVREGDTVARMSGDEYTILLQVTSAEDVAKIAQKILARFNQSWIIDGYKLHITTSIGISLYPSDGDTSEVLLKNADIAMYHAKEQGRNNYQFYNASMNIKAFEQMVLENSLLNALERKEFILYYQPQLDRATNKVVGMEALIRWNHPELGLVYPKQFLPLAERTGIMKPITEWVLRTACKQIKEWQDTAHQKITISVNLSTSQLKQQDFTDMVEGVLEEFSLDPALLELEITEDAALSNVDTVIARLKKLTDKGIKISIDDFGTGYSSLSYLNRLPIHILKIDQSFIRDLSENADNKAIVNALILMAKGLNLKTVAEGVETRDQMAFLNSCECDRMQGYLFCKPLPPHEVERYFLSDSPGSQMSFDIK